MTRGQHHASRRASTPTPRIALLRGNRLSHLASPDSTRFGVRTKSSILVGKAISTKDGCRYRWSIVQQDEPAKTDDAAHYQQLANSARAQSSMQKYFLQCVRFKFLESETTIPEALIPPYRLSTHPDGYFKSSPSHLWSREFAELSLEVSAHVAARKPEASQRSTKHQSFDAEQLRQDLTSLRTKLFHTKRNPTFMDGVGLLIPFPSQNGNYIKAGSWDDQDDTLLIGRYQKYKGRRYFNITMPKFKLGRHPPVSSVQLFESPYNIWDYYYDLPPSVNNGKDWWEMVSAQDSTENIQLTAKLTAMDPNDYFRKDYRKVSRILRRVSVNGRIFVLVEWAGRFTQYRNQLTLSEALFLNPSVFYDYWLPVVRRYQVDSQVNIRLKEVASVFK